MAKTKNKFPEWGRTEDGTEVRLCPLEKTDGKPLYCSRDGAFYSRRLIHGEWRFRRIIVNQRPPRDTRLCHTRYPSVRQYGNVMCHTVMALTWIGPRPDGCECDHINGNIYDWRAENLQWVTPAENRRRSKYLRFMRECDFDPRIFTPADFHHWFSMPLEDFISFFSHYANES